MVKYKCIKAECPICNVVGSIQLFLNRNGEVKYARTRHYSHLDKDSRKPQFTYCKIQDLDTLKTLLLNKGISLTTDKVTAGQVGQGLGFRIYDPQLNELSPICLNLNGRVAQYGQSTSLLSWGSWVQIPPRPLSAPICSLIQNYSMNCLLKTEP